jgi:hypothetical protein
VTPQGDKETIMMIRGKIYEDTGDLEQLTDPGGPYIKQSSRRLE